MNQILYCKYNNSNKLFNNKKKKNFFRFQLYISIFLFVTIILMYIFYINNMNSKENVSKRLTNNYNISKLYSNQNYNFINKYTENGVEYSVIGLIEIPKIDLYYPILSETNDKLLKIAPCRFYGPMPNEYGNLCIAGHNFDNYKFFSKLNQLSTNDKIIIHDMSGNSLSYIIFEYFEVKNNEVQKVILEDKSIKQVTLITCNNSNSNRIIIKAKSES